MGTKKIPTLFKRIYDDGGIVEMTREVQPGLEWVLEGKGEATERLTERPVPLSAGYYIKGTMPSGASFLLWGLFHVSHRKIRARGIGLIG